MRRGDKRGGEGGGGEEGAIINERVSLRRDGSDGTI